MIKSPSDRYIVLYKWGVANIPNVLSNSGADTVFKEQHLRNPTTFNPERDQAIPIELIEMSVDMLAALLTSADPHAGPESLQLLETVTKRLRQLFPGA